ncbi:MAG: hypothetical protein QG608_423 [Actinomycetota bacterium]|nr:hypothetical protein [Actinomycetota bacterium]
MGLAPAVVSTLAGNGSGSWVDGTGSGASFNFPSAVSVAGGWGYVFEAGRIRRVGLASGVVTTVAGSGWTGCYDNVDASRAGLGSTAQGMVNDGSYLYWLDSCSGAGPVRRMSLATGAVSTLWTPTGPDSPLGLTIGPDGGLYTGVGAAIVRLDPGTGATTTLRTSLPTTYAGQGPVPVALAADADFLWVVAGTNCVGGDTGGNCSVIVKVDPSTGAATTVLTASAGVMVAPRPAQPRSPLVSAGDYLYAGAQPMMRIRKSDGSWDLVAGTNGGGNLDGTGSQAWFAGATGMDTDGTDLYVVAQYNYRIRKLAAGTPLPKAQNAAWSQTLDLPSVAVSVVAGSGSSERTDGTGTAASFASGSGLTVVGHYGYVADGGYLRRVDLDTGAVTTVAGTGVSGATDNQNPLAASLSPRDHLASDGTFLYWSDSYYYGYAVALRRMSLATGAISTLSTTALGKEFGDLTVGPGGRLYAAIGNRVVSIDSVTGAQVDVVTLPSSYPEQYPRVNALAADSQSLWATARASCPNSQSGCSALFRIDPAAGTATAVATQTTSRNTTPAPLQYEAPLVSAGDYLYAGSNDGGVIRFAKTTHAVRDVRLAGAGPMAGTVTTNITGIGVYDNALYLMDSSRLKLFRLSEALPIGATGMQGAGGYNCAQVTGCTPTAGDPVDLSTGDLFESATDLTVAGRGVPLEFTRTYDTRRSTIAGRLGYGWTDSYDWHLTVDTTTGQPASGKVTIRQANGAETVFYPDRAGGYLTGSTTLATLTRGGDGAWTYVVRRGLAYTFNSSGQLTAIRDRNGYTTTLAYSSGRMSTVTDPSGRALTFTYDASDRIKTVTDPLPRTVTYSYDASGNLAGVVDAGSGTSGFGYDSAHRLTSMTDPRGNTVTTVYSPTTGQVTSQTDRRGKTIAFAYTTNASTGTNTTTVTHPAGNTDTYTFLNALLTREVQGAGTPAATSRTYTYDPVTAGRTSVTDGLGHTTRATYDAGGNQLTTTDALGRTTTTTYNNLNEPLTVTDPAGITTTDTYDASGNP